MTVEEKIRQDARREFNAGVQAEREKIEGRTAAEARVIVEADLAQWNELGELWNDLDDVTKQYLLDVARAQARLSA